jgi:hypothetical protein
MTMHSRAAFDAQPYRAKMFCPRAAGCRNHLRRCKRGCEDDPVASPEREKFSAATHRKLLVGQGFRFEAHIELRRQPGDVKHPEATSSIGLGSFQTAIANTKDWASFQTLT